MKRITICNLEWKILFLFVVGLYVNSNYLFLNCSQLVTLYIFGMFFEFTTEQAWDYNPILKKSTFTLQDRDVSLIFGLGWVGTLILGKSLGKFMFASPTPAALHAGIGLFIVGNIMEQLFLYFKLWKYNKEHWIATLWTGRPIMIAEIPVAVRVGYFVMGIVVFYLLQFIKEHFGCM